MYPCCWCNKPQAHSWEHPECRARFLDWVFKPQTREYARGHPENEGGPVRWLLRDLEWATRGNTLLPSQQGLYPSKGRVEDAELSGYSNRVLKAASS